MIIKDNILPWFLNRPNSSQPNFDINLGQKSHEIVKYYPHSDISMHKQFLTITKHHIKLDQIEIQNIKGRLIPPHHNTSHMTVNPLIKCND